MHVSCVIYKIVGNNYSLFVETHKYIIKPVKGMKWIILAFIILTIIPFTAAATESTIKSGWVSYYETFTSNGDEYSVRGANTAQNDDDADFAVFRFGNQSGVHVPIGTCKDTQTHNFCFENVSYQKPQIDIDNSGQLQPALLINIKKFIFAENVSQAKVTRSIKPSTTFYGETVTVTLTVTNTGNIPIRASLQEPIPKDFQVEQHDKSLKVGNSVISSNFALLAGDTWTATYDLVVKTYNEREFQTTVTYEPAHTKGEIKKTTSKVQKISINTPYTVTHTLQEKTLDIDEKQQYSVSITNTDDEIITINNIQLDVPTSMRVISTNGIFLNTNGEYARSAIDVEPGKTKTFTISGPVRTVGDYTIGYNSDIQGKIELYSIEDDESFSVITEGIYCDIIAPDTLNPLKSAPVTVTIINSDDSEFYSIQDTNSNASINRLAGGAKKNITNQTITAPFSLHPQNLDITFEGSYLSEVGQKFSFSCIQSVDVPAGEELFTMNVTQPSAVISGDNVTVSVILKDTSLQTTPATLSLAGQKKDITITPNSSSVVNFTLQAPQKNTTLYVTASTDKGYSDTANVSLQVNPPEKKTVEEEEEEVVVTQNSAVEKKDFFKRLQDFFAGLF